MYFILKIYENSTLIIIILQMWKLMCTLFNEYMVEPEFEL